ncbi:MAG: (d)CMP kinase [Propionibacteriaceae bacterium]
MVNRDVPNERPIRSGPTGPLVVAIDGPSGSGKSSTARGVATRLGMGFLDTGAMYRAATWLAIERGIDRADQAATAALVRRARIEVTTDPADPRFAIEGTDVTTAIRQPEISAAVSTLATNLDIRADLIARQRAIIAEATAHGERGIVVEGRDITSVVAPEAAVRVLLVADPGARVARRHAELGADVDQTAVVDQVVRRDRDDSTVAEFHQAGHGVTLVDSTHLDLDEVVSVICDLARPFDDELAGRTPSISGSGSGLKG